MIRPLLRVLEPSITLSPVSKKALTQNPPIVGISFAVSVYDSLFLELVNYGP